MLAPNLYPDRSSQSVPVAANLSLSFSETVSVSNGTLNIRRMSDDGLHEAIDLSGAQVTNSGSSIITVNPSVNFLTILNTMWKCLVAKSPV